jgi:exodeoxyribonuclease V gamma subunit
VRIADRSPAATNPLVQFARALLELADGRYEAASLRQLVTRPLVQNRFGFDADTADSIVRVIDDAAVAWGFDRAHRERWGVHGIDARTWRRALDRALAGVFFTDSPIRVVGDAAPLDGIEGQDARPVGILVAVLDRLVAISDRFSSAMPLSKWAGAIGSATRMLADPGWDDEWQWNQLERLLSETFPAGGGTDPLVSLSDAREAMRSWTDDRPSPLMFRSGDVTVCTLVPMRSVPYRVVCMLGMDDDCFPRRSRSDGDDLLVADPRIGDHDRAGEDRQLLLDATMAAGDHLVITYSGRDDITNAEYPPAVPIAEFGDVLERMVGTDAFRNRIRTRHPLQSFSRSVFSPGKLGVTGPWGFDPVQLEGAFAVQERDQTSLALEEAWPALPPPEVIRLGELKWFLDNPVRSFVSSQLHFGIPSVPDLPDDSVPVELNALEAWALKDRLIGGLARGHDLGQLFDREIAADALPPGQLAEQTMARVRSDVDSLWTAAIGRGYDLTNHQRYMGSVSVNGRIVEGVVFADPTRAHIPVVTPSRIKAKHRLDSFVDLCFLTAFEPEVAWHSMLLARHDNRRGFIEVTIGPLGDAADERRARAIQLLWGLITLFDEGHSEPLALPCETAFAWQRHVGSNRNRAVSAASGKFHADKYSNERDDLAYGMVFGEGHRFDDLHTERFEELCRRLWDPILPFVQESGL